MKHFDNSNRYFSAYRYGIFFDLQPSSPVGVRLHGRGSGRDSGHDSNLTTCSCSIEFEAPASLVRTPSIPRPRCRQSRPRRARKMLGVGSERSVAPRWPYATHMLNVPSAGLWCGRVACPYKDAELPVAISRVDPGLLAV